MNDRFQVSKHNGDIENGSNAPITTITEGVDADFNQTLGLNMPNPPRLEHRGSKISFKGFGSLLRKTSRNDDRKYSLAQLTKYVENWQKEIFKI